MDAVTLSTGSNYEFSDDNINWEVGTLEAISIKTPLTYQSKDGNKYEWYAFIRQIEPQPVFTQAMADNGELPQVGVECIGTSSRGLVMTEWEKGSIIFSSPTYTIFKTSNNIEFCCNHLLGQDFKYKPIDNRSDKEKAIDEIEKEFGEYTGGLKSAFEFAYNKWVGE